jgi:predicted phage baseplate assembly protein
VADALPFALCLSIRLPPPDCSWVHDVGIAWGNVVLVDHGQSVTQDAPPVGTDTVQDECACEGSITETSRTPVPFDCGLRQSPITFSQCSDCAGPAVAALVQDARQALPALRARDESGTEWKPVYDLLSSGATDAHLVVDVEDDGSASVRAGNGVMGRAPAAGSQLRMNYRVGNGTRGNVGAHTICHLVTRSARVSADDVEIDNPLAATGGTDPEPIDEVRLLAPYQFRARLERAITAADYANLALRSMGASETGLQGAAATLRWTGSWYEASVGVDPTDSEQPTDDLLASITAKLQQYRRAGHDLRVSAARYVPLDIELTVCVLPHFDRGAVKAVLMERFSGGFASDGTPGFFNPDNLRFGDDVYVSRLVAAAAAVPGVESADVTRLKRQQAPADDALDTGVLELEPLEIAQVDSDPDFPENGHIEFVLGGGR